MLDQRNPPAYIGESPLMLMPIGLAMATPLMFHSGTFGHAFESLIEEVSDELRIIEANDEAVKIRWLGRAAMVDRTALENEADFRRACIHGEVARHGRTVSM